MQFWKNSVVPLAGAAAAAEEVEELPCVLLDAAWPEADELLWLLPLLDEAGAAADPAVESKSPFVVPLEPYAHKPYFLSVIFEWFSCFNEF